MNIGEVSKLYDVSIDTLRYYEKIGLINPVPRKSNGIRNYDQESLTRIEFVLCMRDAGLSIESLQKYFILVKGGSSTVATRREILIEQKDKLLIQMNKMQTSLNKLDYKINIYNEQLANKQSKNIKADQFIQ